MQIPCTDSTKVFWVSMLYIGYCVLKITENNRKITEGKVFLISIKLPSGNVGIIFWGGLGFTAMISVVHIHEVTADLSRCLQPQPRCQATRRMWCACSSLCSPCCRMPYRRSAPPGSGRACTPSLGPSAGRTSTFWQAEVRTAVKTFTQWLY